ncbi:FecR family protein [Lunatibacter salilacus]|uniref:FecR family protein n=1 Tax=Lunatibacter salilacus TaxID=2483804 RepID=UPI001F2F59DB|nr:FecR family protein [Lunatibacter salilacus]
MEYPTSIRYRDYKLEDFLMDEFFIQWVKFPDSNNCHFWEKWIQEYPHKREMVTQAARFIRGVHYSQEASFSDNMYVETFENIIRTTTPLDRKVSAKKTTFNLLSLFSLRKLVAVLVVGFCCWMGYSLMFQQEEVKVAVVEIPVVKKINPAGKKSLITLSDGSKVYLNAGSSLQYPKQFGAERREVQLTGEAFFDIQSETDRPFIVCTANTQIKVLGTTFNVNQEESGKIAVALVSGKVRVNDNKGNQVNLEPSEMLVMEHEGEFYKTSFDALEISGWKDKKLVFKKDTFVTVQQKIENWYGVDVQVIGKMPKGWVYTGVYEDELLENVLTGIFYTSGITYKIDGKKVTINNTK